MFESYAFDTDRRELHRGAHAVSVAPQVFDLLDYLIRNRERVISKDELISAIWHGRIVSEAALTTRLNVARSAIGDSGGEQRLIKTLPRKGVRFVGPVRETQKPAGASIGDSPLPNPTLTLPDKPAIAVLPFENMSGDPEQDYFADGMVEDIITALSRFKSLFVIARNSSFTYKGKAVEIKQVGRELGVRYVLEGSVRKASGKVRITGQLIEATTGAHLWADRFDGLLDDIFALQDKVTSSVVAAIAPRLVQAEIDRSERKPTQSLDAVDLYYRAINSLRSLTRQGNEDALRLARQAILLDPNFAAAYGVALLCYSQRKDEALITDDDVTEGKKYALRAIEVGADDAFALTRAAHFFGYILKEVGTADVIADQAIAVNPNLSEARRVRGNISDYLGQHELAIEQFHYAMRLNPLDPQIYKVELGLAMANFYLRRFEIASSWATKSLALQKNYFTALRYAMISYAMLGRI